MLQTFKKNKNLKKQGKIGKERYSTYHRLLSQEWINEIYRTPVKCNTLTQTKKYYTLGPGL